MTAAAEELWRRIAALCPPGPPPCAAIARRTGLPDATVSDWFRKRYLPPWPRFQRLLGYFPESEQRELVTAWQLARQTEQERRRSAPATDEAPPAAPSLVQLPYDIADFTGREREVARVTELLAAEPGSGLTIVAIEGMAGSGKTRLAVHVLRRAGARLGDIVLHVDLGGNAAGRDPLAPVDVLGSLLRSLGVADAAVPTGLDDRIARYRAQLEGVRAVLLLDDAASADQVRPLLPGSPSCRVLITSRRTLEGLDGYRPVPLDTFDEAESVSLLRRIVGVERITAEPEAVRQLVALTGRLPLAVSLVARRLRARPAWRVADLVARLEVEEDRLTELAASDVAVRAIFALSYDQLDDQRRLLFRRLAATPGGEFGPHLVAAVAGLGVPAASAGLERLLDEHLVQSVGPDRYRQHDLLSLFARERFAAEESEADRAAAVRNGLEWYLRTAVVAKGLVGPDGRRLRLPPTALVPLPLADATAANDWYDRERLTLDAVLTAAVTHGHDDLAWQLPITLFGFCRSRQSWQQFRTPLELAHAAATRAGDQGGVGWTHVSQGVGEAMLGRPDRADEHFATAARIYRELGDSEGEGVALNNLGENRRLAGDFDAAIALFERDLALSRARDDDVAIAAGLDNLGKAELGRQRYAAAEAALRQALVHAVRAGDGHCEAEVLHDLGQVERATGRTSEAAAQFRLAASAYEQQGDLAAAVTVLADLVEITGDEQPLATAAGLIRRIDEPFAARLSERLERLRRDGSTAADRQSSSSS